jgi:hypothetical protein
VRCHSAIHALVAKQNHQVAGAGLQFGLAVPVRRLFQLIHEAIDSDQNSESDIHCQQRNKHQDCHLEADYSLLQQKDNRANETSERSSDASNNL